MNDTPSQTIGPFFRFALAWMDNAEMVSPRSPGAAEVRGTCYDGDGLPIPDAMLELWQPPRFGRTLTEPDGSYRFTAVRPEPGPTGEAPHIDVSVFARGLLQRLVTRIYFPDQDSANMSDPVLSAVPQARRSTLVAEEADGYLRFDIYLQGPRETVFFAY
jgi:protocatechuate 3,4-dioxygenase alpha subunit